MVRRIKPVSRPGKTETEVRKRLGSIPVRRAGLPDPGGVTPPAVDIYEKEGELVIEMELPGATEKDITILLYSSRVEVKGFKREFLPDREFRYLRLEREFGPFRREVVIPCAVDPDRACASLENGILTIVLKKPAKKAREVDIKGARGEET